MRKADAISSGGASRAPAGLLLREIQALLAAAAKSECDSAAAVLQQDAVCHLGFREFSRRY